MKGILGEPTAHYAYDEEYRHPHYDQEENSISHNMIIEDSSK